MNNKETLQSYNTKLSGNNDSLNSLLDKINNMPTPKEPIFQDKSIEIIENGTQTITPDEGYDALNSVDVIVNAAEDLTEELVDYNTKLATQETSISDIRKALSGKGFYEKYAPRYIRFSNYTGTELDNELANIDTSNISNMRYMFSYCKNLNSLDVSNFNTSNVTDMQSMFSECSSLTELDLSSFDTSNVTSINNMFSKCSSLTKIDLRNAEFTKLINSNVVNTFMFDSVPADCLVIVKDDTAKAWVMSQGIFLTNVKTVAELEAS